MPNNNPQELILNGQKRTIGQLSGDSVTVYNLIKKCAVGDVITYKEISDSISRNIQKNRSILATARNIAQRIDNIVFDPVIKVGIKRLSDKEIIDMTSTQPFNRIRSIGRKTFKKLNCTDAEHLTNDEITKMNATRAMLGAIVECSKPKALKALFKDSMTEIPLAITMQKTLDLFRNNN